MLNREKNVRAIENKDLVHAKKYYREACKEDNDDAWLNLA